MIIEFMDLVILLLSIAYSTLRDEITKIIYRLQKMQHLAAQEISTVLRWPFSTERFRSVYALVPATPIDQKRQVIPPGTE